MDRNASARRRLSAAALLLCPLAAACAPTVEWASTPEVRAKRWQQQDVSTSPDPAAIPAPAATTAGLSESLRSAELASLIARALAANADIGVAAARIERARAELGIAKADMLPVVTASAGISGTRTDDKAASTFSFSEGFAGIDVSYDLDLFGSARAGKRAARERLRASVFDRNAAALVVEAEVARAYVQHAALTDRIALLDRNIANGRELERIINVRLREGAATRVDTGLQAIDVRQLEADRLRLVGARARTRNALAVLVGEEAPLFRLPETNLESVATPDIAPVQPGELLVRRPDIQAAEARIAAASGDIDQARRAFLPSLRLSASALGQAATLSGPIGATLSIGAGLLAPIFDRGRLKGRLYSATASQHESVELYRKALLNALAEAEDALSSVEESRNRQLLIDRIVEEARVTARLARLQYLEGEADLRDVLDADRLLVQAEDARALSVQERINAAIDLYQAIGGSAQTSAMARAGRRR